LAVDRNLGAINVDTQLSV